MGQTEQQLARLLRWGSVILMLFGLLVGLLAARAGRWEWSPLLLVGAVLYGIAKIAGRQNLGESGDATQEDSHTARH